MSWVLLSLRKSELKATHAQYVAQELKISREERQASRRYQHETTRLQNGQEKELRAIRAAYREAKNRIDQTSCFLNQTEFTDLDKYNTEQEKNGDTQAISSIEIGGKNYSTKTDEEITTALEALKEDYEDNVNKAKTKWEDLLEINEEEANEVETRYEEEKVKIETQMETVSQELQVITQSLSQQIQSETIKIS